MIDAMKNFLTATADASIKTPDGPQPPLEHPLPEDARVIRLPEPGLLPEPKVNFLEMIEVRSTIREYSDKEISMTELSFMLWCTQGVKMASPNGGTFRTVPSAGARHAFETYIIANRVENLPPGVYRFLALGHALLPVGDDRESVIDCFKSRGVVEKSAASFIWCADFPRMTYKFGARGGRYLFLDAGHICQNLYLAAETMECGACALGAFDDAALNGALALDGENDFAVYAAAVGKK